LDHRRSLLNNANLAARLSTRETKHRVAIDLVRRQVVVVAELAMTWAAEVGSPLATTALLAAAHR
jgi:hypothetical protein